MKISIIIPTYNREKLLVKCLDSIYSSSIRPYEIIIVDDNSTDNTKNIIKKYDCKYIKLNKNKGAGNARNIGAKYATGNILLFIDSDIVIKKNTLKNLILNIKKYKNIKIICGYKASLNLSKGFFSNFIMYRKTFTYIKFLKSKIEFYYNSFPETAFMGIYKEVFNEFWGFNPKLKRSSCEDHEFGKRINKKYKIYFFKNLEVFHHYEKFSSYTKKLFFRAFTFFSILKKYKKFEDHSFATKNEAINSIISFLIIIFIFISLKYRNIIYIVITLFIILFFKRISFYSYQIKKSLKYILIAPFLDIYFYFIIALGTIFSIFNKIIKKIINNLNFILRSIIVYFNKFPQNIGFFPTARCNLSRCKHCFYWKEIDDSKNRKELKFQEIKKISKKYSNFYYLTITGGEPSLRKDLPEICKLFYKNNKIRMISYHTNGFEPNLIKDHVEKILEYCPKILLNVAVSIDGPKKIHNKIRGNKKSYDNAIKTLKLLYPMTEVFSNLEIQYSSVFSSFSKNSIMQIEKEIKPIKCWHSWTLVRGNIRNKNSKKEVINEYKKFQKNFRIKKMNLFKNNIWSFLRLGVGGLFMKINLEAIDKKKQIVPCLAGKKTIILKDNGDVEPCEMINKKFENVRDFNYDIKKILDLKDSKKILRFIKDKKCYCTHEGNLYASIIFNPKYYPKIFLNTIKILFLTKNMKK